jgi:hypothetical protein
MQNPPNGSVLDRTAVPECRTIWFSFFIDLHFELRTGLFFSRLDRIFWSGLQSQLIGPYGPVFFTVSKKGSSLGPDWTMASLILAVWGAKTVLSYLINLHYRVVRGISPLTQ